MAKKTKIKISSYKNKKGQTVACARVYSEDGSLLSEHEAAATNTQEASSAALHKMGETYKEIGGDYDISNAKIEYDSSKKPLTPAQTKKELEELVRKEKAKHAAAKSPEEAPEPKKTPLKPKFIKGNPTAGGNGLRYWDWPPYDDDGLDGKIHSSLSEPHVAYFARPGDCIINAKTMGRGTDNNTHIVLGQDRNSRGEYNSSDKVRSQSGFSDHFGAGAIDIVAGRAAPYPPPGLEFGPIFTTIENPVKLKGTLESETVFSAAHPGYAMDAARIYISQMTEIDENFEINKRITKYSDQRTKIPSSGIMIKADKVRMHARNDIKIVTGGKKERYTSQGYPINSVGGIHLMAGNGTAGTQHPIPKGDSLSKALNDLVEMHKDLVDILFGFVKTQMSYNKELATHFHQSPAMGASTTPSITGWALGVETQISHFRNFMMEIPKHLYNTGNYKKKYLVPGEPLHINSKYNTTN